MKTWLAPWNWADFWRVLKEWKSKYDIRMCRTDDQQEMLRLAGKEDFWSLVEKNARQGDMRVTKSDEWYDDEWTHRRKISVNHEKVAADLKDFWVLLDGEVDDAHCFYCGGLIRKATGLCLGCGRKRTAVTAIPDMKKAIECGDILFCASDGKTKLNHRVDEDNKSLVWVEIPEVSTTEDTEFFIYYKGKGGER